MIIKELKDVLDNVHCGCKTNDTANRNVVFSDGHVCSWSPALSTFVELPESCKHLKGIVNEDALATLLTRMGSDVDIDIECEDNRWIISTGSSVAEIVTKKDSELEDKLIRLNGETLTWFELPSNFYSCLAICDIPNNMNKLSGVYINDTTMLSTDNQRVNRAKLTSAMNGPILLSSVCGTELNKAETRFNEYAIAKRWVYFRTSDNSIVLACSRLDCQAYNAALYGGLIDKCMECITAEGTMPKIAHAVSVAQTFDTIIESDKGSSLMNVITLTFTADHLVVSSKRATCGKYKEIIPYNKLNLTDPVTVNVNSMFLVHALTTTKSFALCTVGHNHLILFIGDYFCTAMQVLEG